MINSPEKEKKMTSHHQANQEKAEHGAKNKQSLAEMLLICKQNEFLTDIVKFFKIGDDGKNPEQFYAPFMIQFHDGSRWIIYTTTSFRSDRIKEGQWDAYNIKRLDPMVNAAFLVYSDDIQEKEKKGFDNMAKRYQEGRDFSAIDNIFSFSQLKTEIERTANAEEDILLENFTEVDGSKNKTKKGQKWDKEGRLFETQIANILRRDDFLKKWKSGINDTGNIKSKYKVFIDFMSAFGLERTKVKKIDATSDREIIGRLLSGGSPKTDVIVTVTEEGEKTQNYTISCKRSRKGRVSVHQYKAETFASVLDEKNDELKRLLETFQHHGNLKNFTERDLLTESLKKYLDKLAMWALSGEGGKVQNDNQIAQYIVTFNPDPQKWKLKIHTIQDYYNKIKKCSGGHFGSPFSWTYPSGQKKKSIQLKCPVIFD